MLRFWREQFHIFRAWCSNNFNICCHDTTINDIGRCFPLVKPGKPPTRHSYALDASDWSNTCNTYTRIWSTAHKSVTFYLADPLTLPTCSCIALLTRGTVLTTLYHLCFIGWQHFSKFQTFNICRCIGNTTTYCIDELLLILSL